MYSITYVFTYIFLNFSFLKKYTLWKNCETMHSYTCKVMYYNELEFMYRTVYTLTEWHLPHFFKKYRNLFDDILINLVVTLFEDFNFSFLRFQWCLQNISGRYTRVRYRYGTYRTIPGCYQPGTSYFWSFACGT